MTDLEEDLLTALVAANDLQAKAWLRFAPHPATEAVIKNWAAVSAAPVERLREHVTAWSARIDDWDTSLRQTAAHLDDLRSAGVETIPITDPRYPPQLRGIDLPPLVLHVSGDVKHLTTGIAIVGTREPSPVALEATASIARWLQAEEVPVITGMARGTDQEAARASLAAGGTVIGVLPGGPLEVIPRSSAAEYEGTIRSGCLVSETSGRLPVDKSSFLRRNRITSGLARVVLAMSSRSKGGTINQLEWAHRQGRPAIVFLEGAEAQFAVNVPRDRIPYHLVAGERLAQKAVDLWASPMITSQARLF